LINRLQKYLIPLCLTSLLLVAVGSYIVRMEATRVAQQQAHLKEEIQSHAAAVGQHMEQAFAATEILAAIVREHGEIRNFDAMAASIVSNYSTSSVSTLQLAPNGIVTRIYPLEGHETAVGHDLLNDPARRAGVLKAIESKKLGISGPFTLIQGGKAIAGRFPVFVPDGKGGEKFWGLTIALIRISDLLKASNLDKLNREGFDYSLDYAPSGGTQMPIHRSSVGGQMAGAVTQRISLPNGSVLTLAVAPQPARVEMSPMFGEFALLFLAGLLLAAFSYHLLRRRETLELQVHSRTQSLVEANRLLAQEISERSRVQDELRRSNRFLDSVVENIPNMVFVKDAGDLKFVRFNKAGEELTGLRREDVCGRSDFDFFPAAEAEFFVAKDRETLATGRLLDIAEEEIVTSLKGKRYLHTRKIPILDEHGKPEYLLGISDDITDRKHAADKLHESEALFRAIAENAGDLIAMLDTKGRRIYNNPSYRNVFGSNPLLANFDSFTEIHPEDRPRVKAIFQRTVATGVGERAEFRFLLPNGSVRHIESEGSAIRDSSGKVSKVVVVSRDITERRQAEENLRLAARVFENSGEGIIITDADSNIVMVNEAFTAATQYTAEEAIGKNPRILSSGEQDAQFYRDMWRSLKENGEWHGEIRNRRKSGELYTEWLTLAAVHNHVGEITNYVATFVDLTARKQVEERLHFLAYYDELTELPNRVLFIDGLDRVIALASHSRQQVAVLFLDLDRFSTINETLGHASGDLLLKEVSQRLQDCVPQRDSVARVGGDEFTLVLSGIKDPEDVSVTAQAILNALAKPFVLNANELFISASIGISIFPGDGDNAEALINNADSAMRRAVTLGGNHFRYYTLDMNARSYERMLLGTDLRHALERGELQLCYQPLVEIATGKIVGAEALLRWWRQDFGMVPPAAFVPLLEETGLIVPVGEWVLRTACMQSNAWRAAGFGDVFVAVNFSAQQFERRDIVEVVERILRESDFDPRQLEIELTEGTLMRQAEDIIKTLRGLKAMGIKLSVDDFGTGYSSLSYLKRFPLDTLKIDQSFVRDIPDEPDAAAIVGAVIAMGHALKLKIIAEGVETRGQMDFLRTMGCDITQGYYFSHAIAHEEFVRLLERGIAPETMRQKASAIEMRYPEETVR
jgi:diguanylate cyclase (GGDEF)-like protein/PAS domain S-box-containing protein